MRFWLDGYFQRGYWTPGYWIEPASSGMPDTPAPPPPPVADVVRFGDTDVLAAKLATAFKFGSDTISDDQTETAVTAKTQTVKSPQTRIIRRRP